MDAKLYSLEISNPGISVRMMLAFKGVDTQVVDLLPGFHPLVLWLHGFRRGTVPVLRLGGRTIEGSLECAQALEELVPTPSLYPQDPERRAAVEAAERWGEAELQNVPRRIARHALATDTQLMEWLARDVAHLPLPALSARLSKPVAWALARRVDGTEATARAALAGLPQTLERVDALIADGTIGGATPNAADFQIAPSVRLLTAATDLDDLTAGHACAAWAGSLLPDFPRMPASRVIAELRR